MDKTIKSYKAFDENMQCRGFQYEVGKEYDMDVAIQCCERGFHACKSPLEVWNHYDMLTSRFAEVEQSGKISTEDNSTKVCSSHIKIKAELKLADIINIGVEWLKDLTSPSKIKDDSAALNDDGFDKKQIGSSGYSAQIGSSGYSAQIGSSGDYAQIGSSGDSAQIGSSGNSAQIGSSGNYAQIDSTGENAVVMCAGCDSIAKAKIGSWITLAEWGWGDSKCHLVPVCVKTERVDGTKIKPDTWYKLQNGEFVEVKR